MFVVTSLNEASLLRDGIGDVSAGFKSQFGSHKTKQSMLLEKQLWTFMHKIYAQRCVKFARAVSTVASLMLFMWQWFFCVLLREEGLGTSHGAMQDGPFLVSLQVSCIEKVNPGAGEHLNGHEPPCRCMQVNCACRSVIK